MSRGSKTLAGRQRQAAAKTTTGFYGTILTGADKVNYEAAKTRTESELLVDGFYLTHAKLRRILEGTDVKLSREGQVLKSAMEVLVEQEQISEAFMRDVMASVVGFNLDRVLKVMNSSANLVAQATGLDRMGDLKERSRILQEFFFWVMQSSGERHIKEQGIAVLQLLKTEAGIDTEALAEMQARLLAGGEDEDALDDEGGVEDGEESFGDQDSVDVEAETLEGSE